jgi:hypothetical protein
MSRKAEVSPLRALHDRLDKAGVAGSEVNICAEALFVACAAPASEIAECCRMTFGSKRAEFETANQRMWRGRDV